MAVLNPHNEVHENHRFGKDEVKSLCKTFNLNNQDIHLGFIEYKANVGKAFLINSTSCLWQLTVDTLSPSNAECERGFSAINNITVQTIEDFWNYKQCRQLAIYQHWGISEPSIRQNMAWKRKSSRLAKSKRKEDNYYEPLWKAFK